LQAEKWRNPSLGLPLSAVLCRLNLSNQSVGSSERRLHAGPLPLFTPDVLGFSGVYIPGAKNGNNGTCAALGG
jgi:hypothetical protein